MKLKKKEAQIFLTISLFYLVVIPADSNFPNLTFEREAISYSVCLNKHNSNFVQNILANPSAISDSNASVDANSGMYVDIKLSIKD